MLVQEIFIYFLIFILGASFASFLSVYVERGEQDKFFSIKNKSICIKCLRKLNYFELAPVFSFLFLRGKCKTCKTKIPTKLFVGEVVLGVWFLATYFYVQPVMYIDFINLILIWVFGSVFFLLCLEDLENMEVSTNLLYFFLFLSLVSLGINSVNSPSLFREAVWGVILVLPLWFITIFKKNWLGEADPYVFTGIGLLFGVQFLISTILYSVWFGAAYGILYLSFVNKKFERGVQIPFLPIIFFSTLFILIFHYHIIKVSDILFIYESFHIG